MTRAPEEGPSRIQLSPPHYPAGGRPAPEPFAKWARRNPLKVLLGALSTLLAIGAVGVSEWTPLFWTEGTRGPEPEVTLLVRTDKDSCWILARSNSFDKTEGCGNASFSFVDQDDEGFQWPDGYHASVAKQHVEDVNEAPLRLILEVDGVIVDEETTTFSSASVSSEEIP